MMNKLGILGIAIAIAFVAGIISVNPGAEGVSGWKAAVIEIEEFLEQEEISQLFHFDLVSVEDQDSCVDGQVVKRDSDLASSPTGWSCQDDDGGGGTPSDPLDEIKLIPQSSPPSPCTAENLGMIYFQDNPDTTSGILCVCSNFENEFVYTDLIGENICVPP